MPFSFVLQMNPYIDKRKLTTEVHLCMSQYWEVHLLLEIKVNHQTSELGHLESVPSLFISFFGHLSLLVMKVARFFISPVGAVFISILEEIRPESIVSYFGRIEEK